MLYNYFAIDKEEDKSYIFEIEDLAEKYGIFERYCINPNCHCNYVNLMFCYFRVNENVRKEDQLFDINLSFNDWNVYLQCSDRDVLARYNYIIRAFMDSLNDSMKKRFRAHYKKSKVYGRKNPNISQKRCV